MKTVRYLMTGISPVESGFFGGSFTRFSETNSSNIYQHGSVLLKPVDDNPGVFVWIWQYYFYFIKPMIPMSFIGARSKTWKSVLKYDGSVEDMIKYYNGIRYSFSFLGFLAYASLRLLA